MQSISDLIKTWQGHLNQIETVVGGLVIDRHIIAEVQKIVGANPKSYRPPDFWNWCMRQCAYSLPTRVRVQLDPNPNSLSLRNLMLDVQRNATQLTRDWFASGYEPTQRLLADSHFDHWASSSCPSHVDPLIVQKHVDVLNSAGGLVRKFVNKRLAHLDRSIIEAIANPNGKRVELKWDELDRAIDVLEQKTLLFIALLTHRGMETLLPTWCYDWTEIFEHPWKIPRST